MARPKKSQEVEGQIPLIEVEHPMYKKFKSLRRKLEGLYAEKFATLEKIKQARTDTIALIKENGIKPDADGVISFHMDGGIVKITPGESKLTFKEVEQRDEADEQADTTEADEG